MGMRKFQELVGRTDRLAFNPDSENPKAGLLDYQAILTNALDTRPDTNIVGGSVPQEFFLEKRLVCSLDVKQLAWLTCRL